MNITLNVRTVFYWLMIAGLAQQAWAQDEGDSRAEYIRSEYSKFEYQIPMRDGTKLFTAVYVPNRAALSPSSESSRYPILMMRTPYSVGPYGVDQYKSRLGPTAAYEQ